MKALPKRIQTIIRMSLKEKRDLEALSARWAVPMQKIMHTAITNFIKNNYEAAQEGYAIIEAGKQFDDGQTAEVPRENPRE